MINYLGSSRNKRSSGAVMWDELQSTVDKVEAVRSHSRTIHPKMVFYDNAVIEILP